MLSALVPISLEASSVLEPMMWQSVPLLISVGTHKRVQPPARVLETVPTPQKLLKHALKYQLIRRAQVLTSAATKQLAAQSARTLGTVITEPVSQSLVLVLTTLQHAQALTCPAAIIVSTAKVLATALTIQPKRDRRRAKLLVLARTRRAALRRVWEQTM